jgi:hypothetical protein
MPFNFPSEGGEVLKVECILSPQLLRYHMQNIEGFRQVQPLGANLELTDGETGRTNEIAISVTRVKNTGLIVATVGRYSPILKDQLIPEGWESAVYIATYQHVGQISSLLESFVDALQVCFIYESGKDVFVHKESMMDYLLGNPIAHFVL